MSEKQEERIEILRQHLTFLKDNLPAMPWFERQLKANWNAEIMRLKNEQQRFKNPKLRQDEIEKFEALIKSDLITQFVADIGTIRSDISHTRYTSYQIDKMYERFTGITPLSGWARRLMSPAPAGLFDQDAPGIVYQSIQFCLNVPKQPEPPIHPNFNLPTRHPDKTDQYGRRFYIPMGPDGFAIPDFDISELSQIEAAVNMRKTRGAYIFGANPIPRMKTEKELEQIRGERLEEKNKQREAGKRKRETLDALDKQAFEKALKERDKRRKENDKHAGDRSPRTDHKQGQPASPSSQLSFVNLGEPEKEQS